MARPTWCGTHSVISTASMLALARDTVSSSFCLRRIILDTSRAGAVTRSSSATSTVMARPTWCGTHPVISTPGHRSMLALARATVSFSFRLRTNYIWCAGGRERLHAALIGDVNGDRKADLVWNWLGGDINRIYVGLSQGNNQPYSTFQVQTPQDHPVRGGWSGYQLLIGDVNGDGKADLVWNSLGGDINRIYVGLSQAKPDSSLPRVSAGAGSSSALAAGAVTSS